MLATHIGKQLSLQRHAKKLSKQNLITQIPRYDLLEAGLLLPNQIELKQLTELFGVPIDTNKPVKLTASHPSTQAMLDMLDLFYTNKKLYQKLTRYE